MNHASAIVILALLLFGPLAVTKIEHNIELYCLTLGVLATLLGTGFTHELVLEALHEPVAISIAVIVAARLASGADGGIGLRHRVALEHYHGHRRCAGAGRGDRAAAFHRRQAGAGDGCRMLRDRNGRVVDAVGRTALDTCRASARLAL